MKQIKFLELNSKPMTIKWLKHISHNVKKYILFLGVCNILTAIISINVALFMKLLIDYAVNGESKHFVRYFIYLCFLIIGQLLIRVTYRHIEEYAKACLENALRKRLYSSVLNREYAYISNYHSGDLMNRMTSDVMIISDGMIQIVPTLALMLTRLLGAAACLFVMDHRFAYIFLFFGFLMICISYFLRTKMKLLHTTVQEKDGRTRSFIQETVENLLVIRCFGAERRVVEKVQDLMAEHKKSRMEKVHLSNFSQFGFSITMNAGYLFGLVWCGQGILNGTISYGTLVAVQQLIGQLQLPFTNLSELLPKYYAMTASAERLMEIERLPEEINNNDIVSGSEPITKLREFDRICFHNITFAYHPEMENILEQASFEFKKGDYIAVTGESGIGKSTMLKLLLSVYPNYEGTIWLENHRSRSKVDAGHRSLFSYVPQGNLLMSGTIAEVVSFMKKTSKNVSEENLTDPNYKEIPDDIKDACKIACADIFIEELPNKYHTVIGEKGYGLSEGQMQRLAIARAILSDAPILLFDEATSALDEATEEKLLLNLKLLTDKTLLIVTHKPAALAVCNKVVAIVDKKFLIKTN
ncbi:MAG: ABC transporter ATP-binding protein [Herbinix sp.]|nr:ABC transporter ATP-binding protein [Herbinix sp.]